MSAGVLELSREEERPWSRFEIHRALIIGHQLGATLERIHRHESTPEAAVAGVA